MLLAADTVNQSNSRYLTL